MHSVLCHKIRKEALENTVRTGKTSDRTGETYQEKYGWTAYDGGIDEYHPQNRSRIPGTDE